MYAGTRERKHYKCVLQTVQNFTYYPGGNMNATKINFSEIGVWPMLQSKICVAKLLHLQRIP